MRRLSICRLHAAALAAALLGPVAHAAGPVPKNASKAELDDVKRQLAEQRKEIEALRRELGLRTKQDGKKALTPNELAAQRGTGNPGPAAQAGQGGQDSMSGVPAAQAAQGAQASTAGAPATVGQPPARSQRAPEVAPLFEQPGILTPHGKYVVEPSLQFGYASNNRVALVGYTVIPALLIGLVDVREVRRNTLTGALALRTGLTNRLEVELRAPYVYRSDSAVSREILTGSAVDNVFNTNGKHLGDVEAAARYQLNEGANGAFYVAGLRLKSRTGRDPFEVVTDCQTRCVGANVTGTGLPLELPTGSGFYSLQPNVTWLFASDPAVFFGSLSYTHNFKRSNVSRLVLGGEREFLGDIKPGDIIGFNFGMGLALNDKASLSIGYDHSSVGRTSQAGVVVPGAVRTQLGTLLVGYSYRLSDHYSLNVSVGAGLTRDTPDVSLNVRLPASF